MLAGTGETNVSRWNAAWAKDNSLWQWSDIISAETYARLQDCMTYVVEVTAEGYRPFWGTVKGTTLFEELTNV